MKIVKYDKKRGIMQIVPSNLEDLWELYNVIRKGDRLYGRSSRDVKVEVDAARPTKGRRIAMTLEIEVDRVSFQKYNNRLRVSGIITRSPDKYGLQGSHHTFNLALNKPITIQKAEWPQYDLARIERARRQDLHPLIVVSLDDERGCVALLRHHGIDVKVELAARLPGKREAAKRRASVVSYFQALLKELILTWAAQHSLIAVIGPGFLKETFLKFVKERQPELAQDIGVVRSVSTGGVAGIKEAMRSGVLDAVAQKLRVIEETQMVEKLFARLGAQRRDVSYGMNDVIKAIDYGSVELLLITDSLLREIEDEERTALEQAIRTVEKMRGQVLIIHAEHEAGTKLQSLGGIAAFLRYPVD
jgi:protein pelota